MPAADTLAKLERALDRSYMHECPGDPESPEKTDPCSHPALQHMSDRIAAIFTREIFIHIQSAEDEDDLDLGGVGLVVGFGLGLGLDFGLGRSGGGEFRGLHQFLRERGELRHRFELLCGGIAAEFVDEVVDRAQVAGRGDVGLERIDVELPTVGACERLAQRARCHVDVTGHSAEPAFVDARRDAFTKGSVPRRQSRLEREG